MAKYELIDTNPYDFIDEHGEPVPHILILFKHQSQLLDSVDLLATDFKPTNLDAVIDNALKLRG